MIAWLSFFGYPPRLSAFVFDIAVRGNRGIEEVHFAQFVEMICSLGSLPPQSTLEGELDPQWVDHAQCLTTSMTSFLSRDFSLEGPFVLRDFSLEGHSQMRVRVLPCYWFPAMLRIAFWNNTWTEEATHMTEAQFVKSLQRVIDIVSGASWQQAEERTGWSAYT